MPTESKVHAQSREAKQREKEVIQSQDSRFKTRTLRTAIDRSGEKMVFKKMEVMIKGFGSCQEISSKREFYTVRGRGDPVI